MSRLAKKPILLPAGVSFTQADGYYVVKGPKGELKKRVLPYVKIEQTDNGLVLSLPATVKSTQQAFLGTAARLLMNMITGVTDGFEKKLEINGVGFRVELKGKDLTLYVGHSHPVDFLTPDNITLKVEKNIIIVSGIDKELVGQVAANIRKVRKPEPYKGKGIKYVDEVIRRKEGKQVKSEA